MSIFRWFCKEMFTPIDAIGFGLYAMAMGAGYWRVAMAICAVGLVHSIAVMILARRSKA